MTTKLLRQVQEQDQQELADRHNGTDFKQPRRIWCAEALKPELTEAEFAAAQRAVRECILSFPGAKANYDRVDAAWSDSGLANQTDAAHALNGLRQGVSKRCAIKEGPNIAEWIVQLHTLQDIATALGQFRRMGPGREPIPDVRAAKPTVRLVLLGMAGYYEDCDRGVRDWRPI
jgi:hypothetical protein